VTNEAEFLNKLHAELVTAIEVVGVFLLLVRPLYYYDESLKSRTCVVEMCADSLIDLFFVL
jgi:hypothetical protein